MEYVLLHLGMIDNISSRLFIDGKPVCSTVTLMDKEFQLVGEIIAMSLLHGGPARCLFSTEVVQYLTKQPLSYGKSSDACRRICQKVCTLKGIEYPFI